MLPMEESLLPPNHHEQAGAGAEVEGETTAALPKSQMCLYALPQLYIQGAAIIIMTSISKFYSDEMGVDVGFLSVRSLPALSSRL